MFKDYFKEQNQTQETETGKKTKTESKDDVLIRKSRRMFTIMVLACASAVFISSTGIFGFFWIIFGAWAFKFLKRLWDSL